MASSGGRTFLGATPERLVRTEGRRFRTVAVAGTVQGAGVSGLTGSGASYTVTVYTGQGDGELRLDVLDDDTVVNAVGLPLGGLGVGNGGLEGLLQFLGDGHHGHSGSIVHNSGNSASRASVITFSARVSAISLG